MNEISINTPSGNDPMRAAMVAAQNGMERPTIGMGNFCQVMVLMYFCSNDVQRRTEIIPVQ